MIIRQLCLGAAVIGLIASASGGCSSSSDSGTSSSGGTDGGSSGICSSSGSSGTSSGSSGTSSGSSGTSSGSSGTSSGSSGTSGGTDAGNDAGPTVDPAVYCTKIIAACTGANIQYVTATAAADCAKAAAAFTKGTYASSANDVGCRQYHADLATAGGAATHCPHAGMFGGGGTCGEKCDDFCTVAMAACTGADAAYASKAECVTACGNWLVDANKPIGPAWTGTGGGINGVAAEGYNCRSYHLSVALSTPQTHCPHIKATSVTCK